MSWLRCMVVLALAVPLVGCGNGLSRVSGKVTLDGQELTASDDVRVTVFFNPTDGTRASATGLVDEQGTYTVSTGAEAGIAPGVYKVTISGSQLIRSADGGAPGGKRITPLRYASPDTSDLEVTVEPGSNEIDLHMTSN
ncbi:hypothetical protein [Aeoliella sp.]|uniref:hypothetical protein n=1 Tax=Aeoliella sp. TaxID=2795800 RepID=UPI003CCC41A0